MKSEHIVCYVQQEKRGNDRTQYNIVEEHDNGDELGMIVDVDCVEGRGRHP